MIYLVIIINFLKKIKNKYNINNLVLKSKIGCQCRYTKFVNKKSVFFIQRTLNLEKLFLFGFVVEVIFLYSELNLQSGFLQRKSIQNPKVKAQFI